MRLYGSILCAALFALAPLARCEDAPSSSQPVAPIASAAAGAVLTSLAQWPASTEPTHRSKLEGVPNFGKLNDVLWRSGQPSREGYQALAAQGLKTVINLRVEFPQDKDRIPAGVRYVYIPMVNDHAPTDAQAKQLLDTVSNPANWPILIHCTAGVGRTGTMVALVRHSLDNWNHDSIIAEIGNYWKFTAPGKVPMAKCQQDYIAHWEETPTLPLTAQTETAKSDPAPAAH